MKKKKKYTTQNTTKTTSLATNATTKADNYISILKKPVYTYKGKKNQTDFPEFVDLCKKTQKELIDILQYVFPPNCMQFIFAFPRIALPSYDCKWVRIGKGCI